MFGARSLRRRSPAGCLLPVAAVVGLGLLLAFRDTLGFVVFRSGYFGAGTLLLASVAQMVVSAVLRRREQPGWPRRRVDAAMAVLAFCIAAALLVGWEDLARDRGLSRTFNWLLGGLYLSILIGHLDDIVWAVRRFVTGTPGGPAPARDVPTGAVLRAGLLVLVLGLLMTTAYSAFATGPDKDRGLSGLVAGWSLVALLLFGPGVFLTRLRWRRYGTDRPGDRRAALGAGLGIGATVLLFVATGALKPLWREGIFGGPGEPTVVINWDARLVERVALEHDGGVVAAEAGPETRLVRTVPPGNYTARGYKGDREVYVETFAVAAAEEKVLSMFAGASGPDGGYLRVLCDDRGVSVTATGASHTFAFSHPGFESVVGQRLRAEEPYQLTIAHGPEVVHSETVRLANGEQRELRIPHIVRPEKAVELRPKAGRFPSDVVRMEIAPDRSAVAVGRFDGPILVFDVATGRERFTVIRKPTDCTAFGFSPDGKRLAYLIRDELDHVLRAVDANDGHPVGKDLKPPPGRSFSNSHALAYSADGNRLAVSAAHNADPDNHWESRILRWDLSTGAEPRELDPLEWQTGTIEQLRFTPNGSEVLAVAGTNTWTAWAWDTRQASRRNESEVDFTYDRVAAGGPVEAVAGWGQLTKRPGVLFSQRRPSGLVFMAGVDAGPIQFGSLAVSPDGGVAAAGVKGGATARWEELPAVRVWDTGTQQPRAVLLGHTDWPLDIAFDRMGTGLVTAAKDGTVRHWRLP
jgi:hypothetical protein